MNSLDAGDTTPRLQRVDLVENDRLVDVEAPNRVNDPNLVEFAEWLQTGNHLELPFFNRWWQTLINW